MARKLGDEATVDEGPTRDHRVKAVSNILGVDVTNRRGDRLGTIDDVVVARDGAVSYAVISYGGFLGIGDSHVAVPWDRMEFDQQRESLLLDVNEEQFRRARQQQRFGERRGEAWPARVDWPFGAAQYRDAPIRRGSRQACVDVQREQVQGRHFERALVASSVSVVSKTRFSDRQQGDRSPGWSQRSSDPLKEITALKPKNTICLWFDKDAHDAARFYAATFPDSAVTAVHKAPADYPSGREGDVLTVEFTVLGIPCLGLNGGPAFKHSEAFSFQIATDDQDETDRYWNAIVGNGGQESQCGWCRDRWGLSWQITPRALNDALAAGGAEAKRAFEAMMSMTKIDIAAIEVARRG